MEDDARTTIFTVMERLDTSSTFMLSTMNGGMGALEEVGAADGAKEGTVIVVVAVGVDRKDRRNGGRFDEKKKVGGGGSALYAGQNDAIQGGGGRLEHPEGKVKTPATS